MMACVPDTFIDPVPEVHSVIQPSGVFSYLVQWMEWYLLNGVEHFLIYTFKGHERHDNVKKSILKPYFDAGLASIVEIADAPRSALTRQGHMMNDCLYRAKNHAEWLIPGFDLNEYLYVTNRTIAEVLKNKKLFLDTSRFHSLTFRRVRFAKAPTNQLAISSTRYEPNTGHSYGWVHPKQVVHVNYVHRLSIHETEVFHQHKISRVLPSNFASIRQYRAPFNTSDLNDTAANETDPWMDRNLAPLTKAIQKRFELWDTKDVDMFLHTLSLPEQSLVDQLDMGIG
eukprot:Skav229688  [mRNA]  locus=scaffold3722:164462:165313:- [translate_table: standard]